MLRFQDKFYFY